MGVWLRRRFRQAWVAWARLTPDPQVSTHLFGYRVLLSVDEEIQRAIAIGSYEREETEWLMDALEPGMTIVDVGANVGYYSLLAARQVGPQGRVIAFEPSPYCCERLNRAVRDNQLDQLMIEPVALGDQPTNMDLVLGHHALHSPSFLIAEGQGEERFRVPVTTLDAYLGTRAVSRIDLLKVDVEGFEPNVIRGAHRTLSDRRVRSIFCELNDYWLGLNGTTSAELDGMIQGYGFRPVRKTTMPHGANVLYAQQ